jgi:hypothetical protein
LATLLQDSASDLTAADEQYGQDDVDDVIFGCEEDSNDDELEGFELSPQDRRTYKAFVKSTIIRHHRTDRDFQCRTASDIACTEGSHAVFCCPFPSCEDTFDADIAVYKFYEHIEHPRWR